MSDALFDQLILEINEFIRLGYIADTKQSDYGIKHDQPTDRQKQRWLELVEDVKKSNEKLEQLVAQGIEKNKEAINVELATFRELPRKMDYFSCYWSAYYPNIEKLQSTIAIKLDEIDEKYQLGWEHPDYK